MNPFTLTVLLFYYYFYIEAYGRIEQQRSVMGLELNGIKENLQEVE